ncbi:hypothetical protein C8Q77DRAFT_860843 [Trametes polyzona]|nr:hypothetical protein C8Q77DRAFT_860843 [Trametes polyzona]
MADTIDILPETPIGIHVHTNTSLYRFSPRQDRPFPGNCAPAVEEGDSGAVTIGSEPSEDSRGYSRQKEQYIEQSLFAKTVARQFGSRTRRIGDELGDRSRARTEKTESDWIVPRDSHGWSLAIQGIARSRICQSQRTGGGSEYSAWYLPWRSVSWW